MIKRAKVLPKTPKTLEVELETDQGVIDLHNFADLSEITYRSDGELIMVWNATDPEEFRIGVTPIESVLLILSKVQTFSIVGRDIRIPVTEDRTLEEFETYEVMPEFYHFRFTFRGGTVVEVEALEAELIVKQQSS